MHLGEHISEQETLRESFDPLGYDEERGDEKDPWWSPFKDCLPDQTLPSIAKHSNNAVE
jgi:hypothetical protein